MFHKILLLVFFSIAGQAKDYTQHKEVQSFIDVMVKKHNFKKAELNKLFKNTVFQKAALGFFNPLYKVKVAATTSKKKYFPPNASKHGSWTRYIDHLLSTEKINLGINYMRKHRKTFQEVYKTYGVPPEYITAIIGIESRYGVKRGTYPIFDTLTTLAFEKHRRSAYFKSELKSFLLLSKDQNFNPKNVKGSYAGAIGLGQFMPSSYKAYAIDFNKDGKKSIQHDADAIASIGNYLQQNGWNQWEPVAERVSFSGGERYKGKATGYTLTYPQSQLKDLKMTYGTWSYKKPVRLIKLDRYRYDELWFAAKNFYVITRYNHSSYYAMAVHQLAQRIKRGYKKNHGVYLR